VIKLQEINNISNTFIFAFVLSKLLVNKSCPTYWVYRQLWVHPLIIFSVADLQYVVHLRNIYVVKVGTYSYGRSLSTKIEIEK